VFSSTEASDKQRRKEGEALSRELLGHLTCHSQVEILRLSKMKKTNAAFVVPILAVVPASGQLLISDTLTYTGSFADLSESSFLTEVDEGGGSSFGPTAVVTGIPKFDPALGTLTGIRVSASYDYEASGDFFVESVTEPEAFYAAEVFSVIHDLGLYLSRSSSPSTIILLNNLIQVMPESYSIFDPDFEDSFFDFGSWDFSDGEEDIFSSADLSDFVGTGEVTVLDAGVFVPNGGEFFLENVDSVTLDTFGSMTNGQVQVSYDFVPIPEPGTTVMAFSALALGLRRRRTPGSRIA
jgi:hypothetical protein